MKDLLSSEVMERKPGWNLIQPWMKSGAQPSEKLIWIQKPEPSQTLTWREVCTTLSLTTQWKQVKDHPTRRQDSKTMLNSSTRPAGKRKRTRIRTLLEPSTEIDTTKISHSTSQHWLTLTADWSQRRDSRCTTLATATITQTGNKRQDFTQLLTRAAKQETKQSFDEQLSVWFKLQY